MKKINRLLACVALGFQVCVVFPQQGTMVHDPVIAREKGKYYIFSTGWGISVMSSSDIKKWKVEKPVFEQPPRWATDSIPAFNGHIWAPDISFYHGKYYLYYSVSAFGKNTSCIGLATNVTLNPSDSRYKWIDHGMVIQSIPGKTNWNAIDPNLITDEHGTPYLFFGSFWDGIQVVKLTADATHVARDANQPRTIASRKRSPADMNPPALDGNPAEAGGNSIEAPFVFRKDSCYYLFCSIDYCCKGVDSNYKIIVGRSTHLTGPYYDSTGRDMAAGGGTLLLQGDSRWHGLGHNAVATFENTDYIVFHAYDANDGGKPKLRIARLKWKNGWPVVGSFM